MKEKQAFAAQAALPLPPRGRRRGRRLALAKLGAYVLLTFSVLFFSWTCWFFLTPSGTKLRYLLADSIIATKHRPWAKYLLGQQDLDRRIKEYAQQFDEMAQVPVTSAANPAPIPQTLTKEEKPPLIRVEPVANKRYKGYLLYVNDPLALRIVVPDKIGKGEKVSSMVRRTGAIAGVNGGGFADPNWQGNGFQPTGVVVSDGNLFYNDTKNDEPVHIVGIDNFGRLIAGKYKPSELAEKGVKEAVSFAPRFIVNGEGLIKNEQGGWGIAPRTCIAQRADGTIMFAVIDGRQSGSLGATLYDVQQIFLEHGAVIAANLDGGSSTVLVADGKVVNHPSSQYGERLIPTAWLVFEHPEQVQINNIWQGLDMSQFDSAKW